MTMFKSLSTIRLFAIVAGALCLTTTTPYALLSLHLSACSGEHAACTDHDHYPSHPDRHDHQQDTCLTCHLLKVLASRCLPEFDCPIARAVKTAHADGIRFTVLTGIDLPHTAVPRAPPAT